MQNRKQKREPALRDIGLWARYTVFNASHGIVKRIAAWVVLAMYAAFIFGLPPLIWFTWHEWDFCRIAHPFSCVMPLYWIYLAVKTRQRHEYGEPLLKPSEDQIASNSEGFRAWRIALYERPVRVKMVDVAFRLAVLGVIVLVLHAHIGDNGYFWLLCAELAFRVFLTVKRPAHFSSPGVIEPV